MPSISCALLGKQTFGVSADAAVGRASSIAAAKSIAVRGLDFMFTVLLRYY